jgi:hypothetical protein
MVVSARRYLGFLFFMFTRYGFRLALSLNGEFRFVRLLMENVNCYA